MREGKRVRKASVSNFKTLSTHDLENVNLWFNGNERAFHCLNNLLRLLNLFDSSLLVTGTNIKWLAC